MGLLGWTALATLWLGALAGIPQVDDGLGEARLHVFGAIVVLCMGLWTVPGAWRSMRPEVVTHPRLARFGWTAVSLLALIVGTAMANLAVNSRSSLAVAFGSDEMRGGEVLLRNAKVAEIRGPLSAGLGAQLARLMARHPDVTRVVLESPGGWMREGQMLARTIRKHELETYTEEECASACTVAFLAGRRRALAPEGHLGFHGVSGSGADPVYEREWTRAYVDSLLGGRVSSAFREHVMQTPPSDMWYPTLEELLEEGLVDEIIEP